MDPNERNAWGAQGDPDRGPQALETLKALSEIPTGETQALETLKALSEIPTGTP